MMDEIESMHVVNMRTKRIYLYMSISLLIMFLIFLFSSQTGEESSEVSNAVLRFILEKLSDILPEAAVLFLQTKIRKAAHFFIYMLLGIFLFLTAREARIREKAAPIAAWGIAFLYAGTDEIHQRFVPGRSGQFSDVCLDSAGALAGILLMCAFFSLQYHNFKK